MSAKISYRKLRYYKYQLMNDYTIQTGICDLPRIETDFLVLEPDGTLTIKRKYAWDGPSGPARDTKNFMRGSLVHDALYQLMRLQKIELGFREYADRLLRTHCLLDGMSKFRAWYVYKAVRWFGKNNAIPAREEEILYYAP
jgi:hypothetical protein